MTKDKKHSTNPFTQKGSWLKPALCIALFAILFNFISSSTMNRIAQAALNPVKYYQKVEKDNLNKQIDNFTKNYASYMAICQNSLKQERGSDFTIQATLDPSIAKEMGLEGLRNIKASRMIMSKENNSKSSMVFSVNDKELTSVDVYSSIENLNYLLVPDLSKAYLKMTTNQLSDDTTPQILQKDILDYINNPVSEKDLNKILKKYATLAINQVNDVSMKKDESVTVDKINSKYTKLTVRINEKSALNITKSILTTAQSDEEVKKLFVDLGICSSKEYDTSIKTAMKNIASELKKFSSKKTGGKDIITMTILVDKKGNITGRTFKWIDDGETIKFGYQTTKKDTKIGVEAWINLDGQDILKATGRLNAKLTGISGDIALTCYDIYSGTPQVINVSIKNLKYTSKDNNGFINGDIILSGKALNGITINMKCSGDITKQDFVCDVVQSGKSLVTVTMSEKVVPFQDFSLPSSSDTVYDMDTELEKYILNSDMKGFLLKMKEKSDVKGIDDYIDSMLKTFVE